jgi:DNA modification methylase
VFTDPPYGVAYKVKASASDGNTISEARKQGCKNETIANDATLEQAYEIARKAMLNCRDVPIKYVCCDWKSYPTMKKAVEDAGIVQKALIVWDKGGPYQHLDLFAKRHEFIIYAGEYGGKKTVDTDIWSFPREFRADHPTPKSIKLIAHAIECHDNINIVLDVFGGSGSTMIACEQLHRKCRMMELDPHYCTVIIARWEKFTGQKAVKL